MPMPVINILKLTPIRLIKKLIEINVLPKLVKFHDMLSSLKHAFQNSFPSDKYKCTTTKEIESIMSLKSSNSFVYDEVPTKILKLRSPFINSPRYYICNRTLLTGVFPNTLKHG